MSLIRRARHHSKLNDITYDSRKMDFSHITFHCFLNNFYLLVFLLCFYFCLWRLMAFSEKCAGTHWKVAHLSILTPQTDFYIQYIIYKYFHGFMVCKWILRQRHWYVSWQHTVAIAFTFTICNKNEIDRQIDGIYLPPRCSLYTTLSSRHAHTTKNFNTHSYLWRFICAETRGALCSAPFLWLLEDVVCSSIASVVSRTLSG